MDAIGFVGTGHVGAQVARAVVAAGYDVVLSNARGPSSLGPLVGEFRGQASAATVDEAASAAGLVVVAIPIGAFASVPVAPLVGKTVIVTSNYNRDREGAVPALDNGQNTVPGRSRRTYRARASSARSVTSTRPRSPPTAGRPGQRTGVPWRSPATIPPPRRQWPRSTTASDSIRWTSAALTKRGASTAASRPSSRTWTWRDSELMSPAPTAPAAGAEDRGKPRRGDRQHPTLPDLIAIHRSIFHGLL